MRRRSIRDVLTPSPYPQAERSSTVVSPAVTPRGSVRLCTLKSMAGATARREGEPITPYWARLHTHLQKLSVMRGTGMPLEEREVWKDEWTELFRCMRVIAHEPARQQKDTTTSDISTVPSREVILCKWEKFLLLEVCVGRPDC